MRRDPAVRQAKPVRAERQPEGPPQALVEEVLRRCAAGVTSAARGARGVPGIETWIAGAARAATSKNNPEPKLKGLIAECANQWLPAKKRLTPAAFEFSFATGAATLRTAHLNAELARAAVDHAVEDTPEPAAAAEPLTAASSMSAWATMPDTGSSSLPGIFIGLGLGVACCLGAAFVVARRRPRDGVVRTLPRRAAAEGDRFPAMQFPPMPRWRLESSRFEEEGERSPKGRCRAGRRS